MLEVGAAEVIVSYIKTVFVVWAEDRHIFATNQPEYSQILDAGVPAGSLTDQTGNEFQIADKHCNYCATHQPEPDFHSLASLVNIMFRPNRWT